MPSEATKKHPEEIAILRIVYMRSGAAKRAASRDEILLADGIVQYADSVILQQQRRVIARAVYAGEAAACTHGIPRPWRVRAAVLEVIQHRLYELYGEVPDIDDERTGRGGAWRSCEPIRYRKKLRRIVRSICDEAVLPLVIQVGISAAASLSIELVHKHRGVRIAVVKHLLNERADISPCSDILHSYLVKYRIGE